jgi:hypothetical protein
MSKNSAAIRTVDIVHQAIDAWLKLNTDEDLTTRVHKLLDENQKKIVLTLLGFENRWGGWEIDHCNGRAGQTPVGEYIKVTHEAAIKEWLEQVKLPPMPASAKKEIEAEMRRTYTNEVREYMRKRVIERAQADVDALLSTLSVDEFIVDMKKVHKLIKP